MSRRSRRRRQARRAILENSTTRKSTNQRLHSKNAKSAIRRKPSKIWYSTRDLISTPLEDTVFRQVFMPQPFVKSATLPRRTVEASGSVARRANNPFVAPQSWKSLDAYKPVKKLNTKKLKTCVNRAQRKEVIFAQGRGGTKVNKPKYTKESETKC